MTLVEAIISFSLILLISNVFFVNVNINSNSFRNTVNEFYNDLVYIKKKGILEDKTTYILLEDDRYILRESGKNKKIVNFPKNMILSSNMSKIIFNKQGTLGNRGTTFRLAYQNLSKEITITPVSGRILIKEI